MRRIDNGLPSPPNWDNRLSTLLKFGIVLFVGGAAYSVAQTVVALQRGSIPAALITGGMALFISGAMTTFAAAWFTTPQLYAVANDGGTSLRIRPLIIWCWIVSLVGAAFGAACFLVFVSYGTTELPFAAPGRERVNRYLMITLLVISVGGLAALITRREPGYLRIGPSGVENADIFRTRSARWDDVIDISDNADRKHRNPIVFVLRDAKQIIVPNAPSYAAGSPAIYWMVRHYWKHPADRDELTDGRALERLRNAQFAAD